MSLSPDLEVSDSNKPAGSRSKSSKREVMANLKHVAGQLLKACEDTRGFFGALRQGARTAKSGRVTTVPTVDGLARRNQESVVGPMHVGPWSFASCQSPYPV